MRYFQVLISLLLAISVTGQDMEYARSIVDTLSSPNYDGRGYYNNGERRSAEFLSKEYDKIGLKSFGDQYFQEFRLTANSIKGDIRLAINGKTLTPGTDCLIDPSAPTYKDNSKIIYLKKEELLNIDQFKRKIPALANRFVVVDQTLLKDEKPEVKRQMHELMLFLKFSREIRLNGVIEVVEKLTSTASQYTALRPHVVVLKGKLSKKMSKIELSIENVFDENYQSQNVIGYVEGQVKDSFVVIVGHYDHLGRMGDDIYFPGANDNASGIAMILSLAKELAQGEQPKYSVVFICFGAEEIGLVGSKYYSENPFFPLSNIKFLLNLDILGTGDDGIQVVNGSVHKDDFNRLVEINKEKDLLKEVKRRGKACISDHCFFSEQGVPSFYIYTLGGASHYHDVYDHAENLTLREYNDLFLLLKEFIVSE